MALGPNEKRDELSGFVTDLDGRLVIVAAQGTAVGSLTPPPHPRDQATEKLGTVVGGYLTDPDGRLIVIGINGAAL